MSAPLLLTVELSLQAAKARLEREQQQDLWVDISVADLACLTAKRPARVANAYRAALVGHRHEARQRVLL